MDTIAPENAEQGPDFSEVTGQWFAYTVELGQQNNEQAQPEGPNSLLTVGSFAIDIVSSQSGTIGEQYSPESEAGIEISSYTVDGHLAVCGLGCACQAA